MTQLPPTGLLKTRARKFAILEVRREGGRSTAPPIHTPLLRLRMRKSFHVFLMASINTYGAHLGAY